MLTRLSPMTNIVPIIGKADQYSDKDLELAKTDLLRDLSAANVNLFSLGRVSPTAAFGDVHPPYGISAAMGSDAENMDASLLMSPEYIQPLVPSDLTTLVQRLLEPDAMACLRHSAAKKLVDWLHGRSSPMMSSLIPSPGPHRSPRIGPSSSTNRSQSRGSSISTAPTSYALARITDHTQNEERHAQMRLAKWASELQRSLQNERARFAALARRERLAWLQGRLKECPPDEDLSQGYSYDSLVLLNEFPELFAHGGSSHWSKRSTALDHRDPLGVLEWGENLRRTGWVAVQVMGSFGVIGGLAFWLTNYLKGVDEMSINWAWLLCGGRA